MVKHWKYQRNLKRVAVLTGFYVGDFIKLGIKPIAVSDITKDSSILKPYLKGVDYIGENDVEKVAKSKTRFNRCRCYG